MMRFSRSLFRRSAALFAALALVAAFAAPPASAQPQSLLDERPYDEQLLRLSEILGAIHYLRALCGAEEGQLWRNQMKEILRSEGTTAIRRAMLARSFNKGYRGYRRTYRSCNDSARTAIERFMEEGDSLTALLIERE
jgi:uncharacterized protein (TIGR02301 family)